MKKRILSMILSIVMVFTMLPTFTLTASAAECEHTVDSYGICTSCQSYGYCGEATDTYTYGPNVTWSLDDDGLLTISGSGAMGSSYPFTRKKAVYERITKAVVKDGVTSLCDYAFSNLYNLTEATIEGNLVSVGENAFWGTAKAGTTVYFNGNVGSFGKNFYYGRNYNMYIYYNGTEVPTFSGDIYGYSLYTSDVLKIYVKPEYCLTSTKFYNYSVVRPTVKLTVSNDGNGTAYYSSSSTGKYLYTSGTLGVWYSFYLFATPNDGYQLKEWQVVKGDTEITTADGLTSFKIGKTDTEIKAIFEPIDGNAHTITFDANGGSGTMSPMIVYENEEAKPLTENVYTRSNYYFAGWNTQADGKGTTYADKNEVSYASFSGDITLYAVWVRIEFDIVHSAGEGTEDATLHPTITYESGSGYFYTFPECKYTAPEGQLFIGWSVDGASYPLYQPGSTLSVNRDLTVTAIWHTPVAEVIADGETKEYGSFLLASQATYDKTNVTINMLADADFYTATLNAENVILNLNGHTISGKVKPQELNSYDLNMYNNVTINGPGKIEDWYREIFARDDSVITINDGVIISMAAGQTKNNVCIWQDTDGVIIINGGKFETLTDSVAHITYGTVVVNKADVASIYWTNGNVYYNDTPTKAPYNHSAAGDSAFWYRIDNLISDATVTADEGVITTYDNKIYANAGATLTVTPNSGVTLPGCFVNDTAATAVGDGSYTFTMPMAVAEITAKEPHTHSFTYELVKTTTENDTIKATCSADGCTIEGEEKVAKVQIKAPESLTYKGEAITAIVTQNTLGVTTDSIKYEKSTGTDTWEDMTSAPVNVGTYKASISLTDSAGTKTAYVTYSIVAKVTFDAATNGGSCDTTSMTTGIDGKLTSLPTATHTSKVFTGWYTEQTGGAKITTDTVFTKNETVYAQFADHQHDWTYTKVEGENKITATCNNTDQKCTNTNGGSVTLTVPTGLVYGDNNTKTASVTGEFTTGMDNPDVTYQYSATETGTYTEITDAPANAGWYKATISVANTNGEPAAVVTLTYQIAEADPATPTDTTAPTISFGTLPTPTGENGWYTENVTVPVIYADEEGGSGVAKWEYYAADAYGKMEWRESTESNSFKLDSNRIFKDVRVRVTDNAGNTSEEVVLPVEVKVCRTWPYYLEATATVGGQTYDGNQTTGPVTFTLSGQSPAAKITKWEYSTDNGATWNVVNGTTVNTHVHSTDTPEEGVTYIFRATNEAGWTSSENDDYTDPITVKVKNVVLYNVYIDSNLTGGTITASPTSAKEGETITLTATPEDEYVLQYGFINYTPEGGSMVKISTNTFNMPAANVTVSANFVRKTYGARIVQTDPALLINATATLSKTSGILAEDVVTLTFTPDEGKVFVTPPKVTYINNAKAGSVVAGENGVYTCEITNFSGQANIYVSGTAAYAFTVNATANPTEGGTVTGSGIYEKDATVTLTAKPATGYKFKGWTSEDGVVFADATATTTTFTMPEKDVTVTATFAALLPGKVIVNGVDLVNGDDDHTINCGDGTAVYDPNTLTLTLTGAEITNHSGQALAACGIYASDLTGDFTIVLNGKNSITLTDKAYDQTGIWQWGKNKLTIQGSGSLAITLFDDAAPDGIGSNNGDLVIKDVTLTFALEDGSKLNGCVLHSNKSITIDNANISTLDTRHLQGIMTPGNVTIKNGSFLDVSAIENAVYAEGDIAITDSTVTAKTTDYAGICCWSTTTITDSTVTAHSDGDSGIYSFGLLTISGGKVTATTNEADALNAFGGITIKDNADVTAEGYGAGVYTNDTLTVGSGKLTAKGTNWAILARKLSNSAETSKPTDSAEAIVLGTNIVELSGATVKTDDWTYTEVWDDCVGDWTNQWMSRSYFVDAAGTKLTTATVSTGYVVQYKAGADGTGDDVRAIKLPGEALTLQNAIFTRAHYTQTGWATTDGGAKAYELGAEYTAEANTVLYPFWEVNQYTVTLNTNGGTINAGDVTEYTYGIGATLPTDVTRSGYTFAGWYDNEDCKGAAITEISETDVDEKIFYAKWNMIYIGTPASTYSPVIEDTVGGDVVVTPAKPEKGDTVIITPEPDTGNEVDAVVVTDKNGNPVAVTDNGDGTYSFKQPTGKVTIEVTYKEIVIVEEPCDGTAADNCPSLAFSDLDTTQWYHESIDYVLDKGMMKGTGDGIFAPDGTLSRAMLVTILWRLEGEPSQKTDADFVDVAAGQWYTAAVHWASANEIVLGYGDGTFGPNDYITREQLATILYRYEQYKGGGFTGAWMINMDYVDLADVSDWAYEAMCWCNMNGIVNGKSGKVLDPKGSATRAEAAAMLNRYCEVIAEKEEN